MSTPASSPLPAIAPEGTHNFRDTAGMPLSTGGTTASGVLYRSDALSALTPAGLEQLAASDIDVIIDFRTPMEQSMSPDRLPTTRPIQLMTLGVLEGAMTGMASSVLKGAAASGDQAAAAEAIAAALAQLPSLGDLYISMLQHGASSFAEAARTVATTERGVLVHCTAGKDRTGVAVALILEAVGVERDAIVADYAVSESNLAGPWTDRMFAMLQGMGLPRTEALDQLVAATPPEAIRTALSWVHSEHGGAIGYLRSGGLTDAELDALGIRLT